MNTFSVGTRYPEFASGADIIRCAVDASGITLFVSLAGISASEEAQFQQDAPFEVRYCVVRGVFFWLVKFGSMEWMDAPYNPALGEPVELDLVDDGAGYALTILLFDSRTGELRNIRLIGLGTDFSRAVRREIQGLLANPLPAPIYDSALASVMAAYPTRDLVRMARQRYKI